MATKWTVPKLWEGRTVAIAASGPSMSQENADIIAASGAIVIATNCTHELFQNLDMLYGADSSWWMYHAQKALQRDCLKVTSSVETPFPAVLSLTHTGRKGFDESPSNTRGADSAYAAAHCAVHAGCSRIVLCGVDLGGTHWHGDHPAPLRRATDAEYQVMYNSWMSLIPVLESKRIQLVNTSRFSRLFARLDFMPLAEALQE